MARSTAFVKDHKRPHAPGKAAGGPSNFLDAQYDVSDSNDIDWDG
jgi:hypothetical protein